MSFPEIPLLVYPSFAKRHGVEESILFYLCTQLLSSVVCDLSSGDRRGSVALSTWKSATQMWSDDRLAQLLISVADQQLLSVDRIDNHVVICIKSLADNQQRNDTNVAIEDAVISEQPKVNELPVTADGSHVKAPVITSVSVAHNAPSEDIQTLPVYDVPPAPAARSLPMRRASETAHAKFTAGSGEMFKNIGPAPSFGRYRRESNAHDPFKILLDEKEQLNKKLYSMTMEWKPSNMLFSTLTRSNIPHEVAVSALDEFRLYYCDKNTKERSWDQKFLAWVKGAWVKKQSAANRATTASHNTGFKHENSQRDSREKRKRITAAIMDINDTSW